MSKKSDETIMPTLTSEQRTFTKLLRVSLTDDELISAGDNLAREHGDLRAVNKELDSIKADYKAKVTAHESRIETLSIKIRDKFEMRGVDCVEVKDYDTKTLIITRTDSGEIIEQRMLRQDELQIPLAV